MKPFLTRSEFGGATVYHSFIFARSPNIFARLLSWLIFHVISLFAGLILPRRVDVILTPSPLLSLGIVAWVVGLRHNSRFVYNVQELYPDLAVGMGRLNNRLLLWILYRLESFVYRIAGAITTITPEIASKIVDKGVHQDKVLYIPNWVDTELIAPVDKTNLFSSKHGLDSKFVVSYAGNIGVAQSFDEFLEAAGSLKELPNIQFVLIGDGPQRNRISEIVRERSLTNVTILPYQPLSLMPEIYGSTDLGFVPLRESLGSEALPSKVYRIMASATAVLALTENGSGLANLVTESDCGAVIAPGSGHDLASAIEKFATIPDLATQKGLAGRQHVEKNYSRSKLVAKYIDLLNRLTQ